MLFICESHGKLHYPYCTGRVAGHGGTRQYAKGYRSERQSWKLPPTTHRSQTSKSKPTSRTGLHSQTSPSKLTLIQPCTQQTDRQTDRRVGKTCCWNSRKVLLFAGLLFNFFVLLSDFIPEPRWTWLSWLLTHHCEVKYTASPHQLRKINGTLSPPPTPTPTLPSELEIKNLQKDSRWLCQRGGWWGLVQYITSQLSRISHAS